MRAPSRVLLLEDDVLIRRFIVMALDELPIEMIHAASIAEARKQLGAQGIDLLISDLMLPDGHAIDLLRALRAEPRHAGMRIVILSAGITAAVRAETAELDVLRVLDKPVPYAELIACVEQAIDAGGVARSVRSVVAPGLPATQRERAIEENFGGQKSLFDEFLADCLTQLPADVAAGNQACERGDAQALRRLAHNLKSVLHLIGDTDGQVMARRLEHAAAEGGALPMLVQDWRSLCARIDALCGAAG